MHLLLIFALGCLLNDSIESTTEDQQLDLQKLVQLDTFPRHWVGDWEGELFVLKGEDTLMSTLMSIDIHPTDTGSYTWLLSYGERQEDQRPYLLRKVDSVDYHWVIDEQNSIILDAYYHGAVLYSRFEVMGNLLFTRDEVIGDTLHHEIVTGHLTEFVNTSGNTVSPTLDTIPAVNSYRLSTVQKAKLTRRR